MPRCRHWEVITATECFFSGSELGSAPRSPGIERLGEEEWKREVIFAVMQLKKSFIADYVVLGGGNVHRFDQLPEGIERGKNENAFLGGLRLWETDESGERKWQIF